MWPSQAALHRGMKGDRVGVLLGPAPVEHRRQIGAAAEPGLGGDDEAGVHMHRRDVRIAHMRDHRNARGPEARDRRRRPESARGIPARIRHARSSNARRPFRTAGRASSTSRRRRRARRYGRCGPRACARSGRRRPDRARPARRPRAARRPRRCRRASASNQLRARALRSSMTEVSMRIPILVIASDDAIRCETVAHGYVLAMTNTSSPAARNSCSSRCSCRDER